DYYQQWRSGQIDDAQWRCVRFATVNDNSDPRSINANGFKFSQMDSMVQNVILPMRQRLQARGERLFINLTYTAFTNTICSPGQYHHDDSPEEYAEIIQAATQHLRTRYGITPDAWEVILEPDNTSFWRGQTIGAAIVATASRLSGMGITAKFITPSTARPNNAAPYFDAMVSAVPGAIPHLLEISYHRYGSPTTADLQGLASRAVQRGISTSMLEHIGSGYQDLHDDLKHARVSAWQQFALAFGANDDGSQYFTVSGSQVNIASRTRFLRQYFKYVRAGAVRIDATSANAALDPLAFINTNGGYVVVVKATAAASFTVGGLPAGQYGIKYTTSAAYDVNHPDVTIGSSQTVSTSIPAAGVITIYRK
ncbi:MAG TPA: glycoside hydrolase family 30 beta sandwich domain-containing protein, partial [Longimicrobiales bacterium]